MCQGKLSRNFEGAMARIDEGQWREDIKVRKKTRRGQKLTVWQNGRKTCQNDSELA